MVRPSVGDQGDRGLTVAAEDDEPAWSHLQRIAVLNNLANVRPLLREWGCLGNQASEKMSRAGGIHALHCLSAASSEDYETYCRRHGMGCMVGVNGQIEETCHYLPGGKLKSLFRGPAYILPPHRQAKFCRNCQRADLARRGFTWFRRVHQVIALEFCPVHEGRLTQCRSDYASLSNTRDVTEGMSENSTELSPKSIALAMPEIQAYAELIVWRWQENCEDRIDAMRDLAGQRFSRYHRRSLKPSVYDAIMGVFAHGPAREWFEYHFVTHFGWPAVINDLCSLPLRHIPFSLLAAALAADVGSSGTLIPQLEAKLEKRRRQVLAAQR